MRGSLVWLLLIPLAILATSALAVSPCQTVALSPAPRLATGLIWDWSFEKLLLVDVLSGELQTYSKGGIRLARWANPGSGPYNFSRPIKIVRSPQALVLNDYDGKFIELDARLTPIASHDLSGFENHPKCGQLASNMSRFVMTGDGVVGLGATRLQGQRFSTAWLRVIFSPRNSFEVLKAVPYDEPFFAFMMLSPNIMATLDRRVYALSFEPFGLLEIDGSATRLRRGLPEAFGKLPALPPDRGKANAQERVAVLSSSTGAAHVYADGMRLYVVLRDMRSGTRQWLLARYDPDAERVTGVWRLPSVTRQLFLAPGPKQWALLEVEGRRVDDTDIYGKLVLFPAPALAGAGGTVDAPTPVCEK